MAKSNGEYFSGCCHYHSRDAAEEVHLRLRITDRIVEFDAESTTFQESESGEMERQTWMIKGGTARSTSIVGSYKSGRHSWYDVHGNRGDSTVLYIEILQRVPGRSCTIYGRWVDNDHDDTEYEFDGMLRSEHTGLIGISPEEVSRRRTAPMLRDDPISLIGGKGARSKKTTSYEVSKENSSVKAEPADRQPMPEEKAGDNVDRVYSYPSRVMVFLALLTAFAVIVALGALRQIGWIP